MNNRNFMFLISGMTAKERCKTMGKKDIYSSSFLFHLSNLFLNKAICSMLIGCGYLINSCVELHSLKVNQTEKALRKIFMNIGTVIVNISPVAAICASVR